MIKVYLLIYLSIKYSDICNCLNGVKRKHYVEMHGRSFTPIMIQFRVTISLYQVLYAHI